MSLSNVESLIALLRAANRESYQLPDDRSTWIDMAQWLAARGVLAVDSLTDQQAEDAAKAGLWYDGITAMIEGDEMRAALRRLASGEPE